VTVILYTVSPCHYSLQRPVGLIWTIDDTARGIPLSAMSDEDIETFLAFSGAFDRSTASIFLKVCHDMNDYSEAGS